MPALYIQRLIDFHLTVNTGIILIKPLSAHASVWQVLVFAGGDGKNVFPSVVDFINGFYPTPPLVRLDRFGDVWAKLEFFNPLSRSIKDRTVQFLLRKYLDSDLRGRFVFEAPQVMLQFLWQPWLMLMGLSTGLMSRSIYLRPRRCFSRSWALRLLGLIER
ncbi:hypothetical protein [Vulcanisaeta souniana]|uniref:hypothetical protein n=1 Tax=Vulcanisaeta souniana TaxID=164452 RepID=UPI000AE8D6B9|nr:hypothetical protein [Vulcanisaeta souniana]